MLAGMEWMGGAGRGGTSLVADLAGMIRVAVQMCVGGGMGRNGSLGVLHGSSRLVVVLVVPLQVAEAAVVGYPHDIKGEGIYVYATLKASVGPCRIAHAMRRTIIRARWCQRSSLSAADEMGAVQHATRRVECNM